MCLAIPGKVIEIYDEAGLKMGKVDYNGVVNKACLAYVPDIEVGQYTIVHAGFGISVLDEAEAQKSLETWDELLEQARQESIEVQLPIPNRGEGQGS